MPAVSYTFTASGHAAVVAAFKGIATAAKETGFQAEASFKRAEGAAKRAAAAAKRTVPGPPLRSVRARAGENVAADKAAARILRSVHADAVRAQRERTRDELREINKRMRAREREARAAARAAARERRTGAAPAGRALSGLLGVGFAGGIGGSIAHAVGGAIRNGILAAVAAGTAVAGAATRDAVQLEEATTRLAVTGTPLGGTLRAGEMARNFQRVAAEVPGARAEELAAGTAAFVKRTGRLDIVEPLTKLMAEIGVATGTEMRDIGFTFAELFQKFDIKTVEEFSEAIAALAIQGKRGAVELTDVARVFPRFASSMRAFGAPGGLEGTKISGGLLQIAKQGTGSVESASTNLQNFMRDITKRAAILRRTRGVEVFTGEGADKTHRDPRALIVDLISKTGGDLEKLTKDLNIRGFQAIAPILTVYKDLVKSGKSEVEVRKELLKWINSHIYVEDAAAEIQRDLAAVTETTASKLTNLWQEVVGVASKVLLPAFKELVDGGFDPLLTLLDEFFESIETASTMLMGFAELLAALPGVKALAPERSTAAEGRRAEREGRRIDREITRVQKRAAAGEMTPEAAEAKLGELYKRKFELAPAIQAAARQTPEERKAETHGRAVKAAAVIGGALGVGVGVPGIMTGAVTYPALVGPGKQLNATPTETLTGRVQRELTEDIKAQSTALDRLKQEFGKAVNAVNPVEEKMEMFMEAIKHASTELKKLKAQQASIYGTPAPE